MISAGISPMTGMGIGSAVEIGCGAVTSIVQAIYQGKMLGIQKRIATARFAHQDSIAEKRRDQDLHTAQVNEESLVMQQEGFTELKKSEQALAKAEGQVTLADAHVNEAKSTQKASSINEGMLNHYFYGVPSAC